MKCNSKVRCYVTVTDSMKEQLKDNGLKPGYYNSTYYGYPEVYMSEELALNHRSPKDAVMVELELEADSVVGTYPSGVLLLVREIYPDNIVEFREL